MTDAINIRHLNKWYGKYHALKDINLDIAKGERSSSAARPVRANRRSSAVSTAWKAIRKAKSALTACC